MTTSTKIWTIGLLAGSMLMLATAESASAGERRRGDDRRATVSRSDRGGRHYSRDRDRGRDDDRNHNGWDRSSYRRPTVYYRPAPSFHRPVVVYRSAPVYYYPSPVYVCPRPTLWSLGGGIIVNID